MNPIPFPRNTAPVSPKLTPDAALEAAAALVPRLAERAAECERLRRVPEASIAELHAAGLMRLMQPTRFGGSELGLGSLMDVVLELCKGCASTP